MAHYIHDNHKNGDYHGNDHQHYPSTCGDSTTNFFNRSSDGFAAAATVQDKCQR